ncbi:hypothetical protein GCM10022276_27570 [Sphingomonas limnosediminicola]|uniref:Uncharacterized protein n=1 Tax=Sphingomonas limnosediminicola TaxID=940133 RepID=A0ABP7LUD7_9SPHN
MIDQREEPETYEVTPAMIEAGTKALAENFGLISEQSAVREVYIAMCRASAVRASSRS